MSGGRKKGPPQQIQKQQAHPLPTHAVAAPVSIPQAFRPPASGMQIQFQQESVSSPLPLPHLMEAYDSLRPGLADKIIAWTEAEHEHRRGLDRRDRDIASEELTRSHHRNMWSLFASSMVIAMFGGIALFGMMHNMAWGGVAGLVSALAVLISVLLSRKELLPFDTETKQE